MRWQVSLCALLLSRSSVLNSIAGFSFVVVHFQSLDGILVFQVQARKDKEQSVKNAENPNISKSQKTGRTDIDEEDAQESYFNWVEEQEARAAAEGKLDEDEEVEYDAEGNPIRYKKVSLMF